MCAHCKALTHARMHACSHAYTLAACQFNTRDVRSTCAAAAGIEDDEKRVCRLRWAATGRASAARRDVHCWCCVVCVCGFWWCSQTHIISDVGVFVAVGCCARVDDNFDDNDNFSSFKIKQMLLILAQQQWQPLSRRCCVFLYPKQATREDTHC